MSLPEYMTLNLEDDIHTTDIKPPYGDSWDDVSIEDRCQIAAVLIDDGIHSRDIHHSCDLKSIQVSIHNFGLILSNALNKFQSFVHRCIE